MPRNLNFRCYLHCRHTFWYLKLKTKDFSKFHEQYPCTFQTTACMHLTLWWHGILRPMQLDFEVKEKCLHRSVTFRVKSDEKRQQLNFFGFDH